MALLLPLVPGVYPEPRPRPNAGGAIRTDVCGFVGFEPRVRDAGSTLTATAHQFAVRVTTFQVLIAGVRRTVPASPALILSSSASSVPLVPGGSVVFGLFAVEDGPAGARLVTLGGDPRPDGLARGPSDGAVDERLGSRWLRVVEVEVRRDGAQVRVDVVPRLEPAVCEDFDAYQSWHGPFDPDDGNPLGRAVRAFFANGGRRCWIATVRRVDPEDPSGVRRALEALTGLPGTSEREATGFERLLLTEEVAIVDLPDLYARRWLAGSTVVLPPTDRSVCFRPCGPTMGPVVAVGPGAPGAPVFTDGQVLEAQRTLIRRAATERWRVQLLLSVPVDLDPEVGDWQSPDHLRALAWRAALEGATDDPGAAATALYHPWIATADRDGGPLVEVPPSAFAAGILARRDLARGPAVAPANELVIGALATTRPVDDDTNGLLYETPTHVNVMRAFPGRGVLLWGARTLSSDPWLRYLNVRRGLSAIERRVVAAFRPLVFEPNTPVLWFQMGQVALGVLFELFQQGALRGASPSEAFYVRCDDTNNPPDAIAAGRVVCEVGVAIAAPAEFVVFRVARSDALVAAEEG